MEKSSEEIKLENKLAKLRGETATEPQMTNWKTPLGLAIFLSFSFAFNIAVFGPAEIYFSNSSDFWFGPQSILPVIAAIFLIVFAICFVFCKFLPGKVSGVMVSLIFSGLTALYLQGNFMSNGYPIMDGEAIPWDEMIGRGWLNLAIWTAIIVIPLVIFHFRKNLFRTLVKAGSLLILGIEIVTLITLAVTESLPSGTNSYLSTEDIYKMSQKENIVVIVSDTYEAEYMRWTLEDQPQVAEMLRGFTFYENTTGVSTNTYLSMGTLLSGGEVFPVAKDANAGMRDCMRSETSLAFHKNLHDLGYDINYYTDGMFIGPNEAGMVDNLVVQSVVPNAAALTRVSKLIYKFTCFKYMPHFLKPRFVVDTAAFDQAKAEIEDYPLYTFDDQKFYNDLKNRGIDPTAERGQYIIYHLSGVHAPYVEDRNFNPVKYDDNVSLASRRYEKSLSQMKTLQEMIQQMKDAGVYDNTHIIFTADHGNRNRFNPVFMVKLAGDESDFKVSSSPVSLAEDYPQLIKELAMGKGADAALFQIPENEKRERFVYSYFSLSGYGRNNDCRITIAINGHAEDMDSYEIVKDEYAADESEKEEYQLGDVIGNIGPNCENAHVLGIDAENAAFSKTASICLKFTEKPQADMEAVINLKEVFGEEQSMTIRAGDKMLFNEAVPQGHKSIVFNVPADTVADDGTLTLSFDFPDTHERIEDFEGLWWFVYQSFAFDTLTLNTSE